MDNGEFYDFERIQDELTRRGHRLRTRSDSEIALHLYEERGVACLEQLRGEFAFVLWDGREGRLFAARDRFGIKPLYYAWRGEVLFLASEAKALFAAGLPALEASVGRPHPLPTAADQLARSSRVCGKFPGHYLVASRRAGKLVRAWTSDCPLETPGNRLVPPTMPGSFEGWTEAVRLRCGCAGRLLRRAEGLDSCAHWDWRQPNGPIRSGPSP